MIIPGSKSKQARESVHLALMNGEGQRDKQIDKTHKNTAQDYHQAMSVAHKSMWDDAADDDDDDDDDNDLACLLLLPGMIDFCYFLSLYL